MKNTTTLISFVGFLVLGIPFSHGDLIVNGDFTGNTLTTSNNHLTFAEVDAGWVTKSVSSAVSWGITGGEAVLNSADANSANLFDFAQASRIGSETGNSYNLSFDWTAPVGATGDALTLQAVAVAWIEGNSPMAAEQLWNGLNFAPNTNNQARAYGGTGESLIDLNDASTSSGNHNPDEFLAIGTAGSTESFSFNLNFGSTSIEDYDVIGVRFTLLDSVGAMGIDGYTLDNVSIASAAAAVPEPSSFALLGLGGLGLIARRKLKRRAESK